MEKLINRCIKTIHEVTESVNLAFGELTKEQLNWKPSPDAWSIAQNLHHLIVINESYYPILQEIRKGDYKTPWIGKINFLVSFSGNMVLKFVQPDTKRKTKTFPIWEPSKSEIDEGIVDRFLVHQDELKTVIKGSEDLLADGIVIPSPANKNIVYKLSKAFEIIVAHEKRHLNQALEVKKLLMKRVE